MKESDISKIIKDNLLEDFHSNNRTGLYAVTQKIMAYNSNRIEGSTLTSEQTASLFDTGAIVSNGIEVYKAKDIEEMTGHFRMFNQMLKFIDEPLSAELIKSYHYQLKSGVFENIANEYPIGEFKNRMNQVSDIQTVKPSDVSEEIDKLLKIFNDSPKKIEDIASFHAEYERIHPFQDGNGRTGRMIIIKQCLNSKLIPVIIKDDDKMFYYKALHSAQADKKIEPLVSFFQKSQQEYLQNIKDYIEDYVINKESPEKSAVRKSQYDLTKKTKR